MDAHNISLVFHDVLDVYSYALGQSLHKGVNIPLSVPIAQSSTCPWEVLHFMPLKKK